MQASGRAVGSGRTRVGGYWTRKCWRAGPRAAACASNEWPQRQRQRQQQQRSGLQDVQSGDQNGCREMLVDVVVVGGANLTVRTRRWVGPYKSRGCGARRRGFFVFGPFDPDWGGKVSRGGGIGFDR